MKGLTDKLHSTQCSFVRCIKPNPLMQAGLFDRVGGVGGGVAAATLV
jgi:myosin heavy subunit